MNRPCTRCGCFTGLIVDVHYVTHGESSGYVVPEPYCQECQDKDDVDSSDWDFSEVCDGIN